MGQVPSRRPISVREPERGRLIMGPSLEGKLRDISEGETQDYVIRAVVRAAAILELLRASDHAVTLNEVTERSGLAKASVFRMLRTLQRTGLVERVQDSDLYRLGVRCLELGQAYLEQTDLRREALPILRELKERFNETVHLAVLDDQLRVVYLEKLQTSHPVGLMMSRVGRTAPSYCTGLGKALLAAVDGDPIDVMAHSGALRSYTPNTLTDLADLRDELSRIRGRAFALDLEEHEQGVRCVASAIPGSRDPVAAISIAGPAQRLPERKLKGELARAVIDAAMEIGRRVGAARKEVTHGHPRG